MKSRLGLAWLLGGYLFLYVPILSLVVFSFNESKLVTVWSGFSLKWYTALSEDTALIDGLTVSLKVALLSATASVLLGTLAAFALVRYRRFAGRTLFIAHINAPLVAPEVITGLSLLLFFVACENLFGPRGLMTILIGHTAIGASYAAVVIQSRLLAVDRSLEEAAMDLGCRPFQVFYLVTLPMIAQSMLSAWLLTFTLSLDNVVTSAFLAAPGTTTLPQVLLSRARLGLDPKVNAVATLMIAVVGVAVLVGSLWLARQERRRSAEQAAAYREATA